MRSTIIILLGLALAGGVGAYFAKRELDKLLESIDNFPGNFS